jgi:hypothetical protein
VTEVSADEVRVCQKNKRLLAIEYHYAIEAPRYRKETNIDALLINQSKHRRDSVLTRRCSKLVSRKDDINNFGNTVPN